MKVRACHGWRRRRKRISSLDMDVGRAASSLVLSDLTTSLLSKEEHEVFRMVGSGLEGSVEKTAIEGVQNPGFLTRDAFFNSGDGDLRRFSLGWESESCSIDCFLPLLASGFFDLS
jgi:hypothetical protein